MLMPLTLPMLLAAGLDSQPSLHSIPSLHSNQEGDFRLANEEQQKAISLQGALSRWDSEHRESDMCQGSLIFLHQPAAGSTAVGSMSAGRRAQRVGCP